MTTIFALPFAPIALAPLVWALAGLVGSHLIVRRRPPAPLARDDAAVETLRPAA